MYKVPCYRKVQTTHLHSKQGNENFSPISAMRTMRTCEGQPLDHLNLTTPFLILATQTVSTERISRLFLHGQKIVVLRS